MKVINPLSRSERIYQILKKMILEGPIRGKIRLPSSRVLAKQFGASPRTILDTITLLEKDKLVYRKSRSGVYIANASNDFIYTEQNANKTKNNSAVNIVQMIQADIQQGKLKVGSFLPMQKFLAFQYHTSRDTIQKSLELLSQKGMLHRKANHWIAGGELDLPSNLAKRKNVYVIGIRPPQQREFDDPNTALFFRSFEDEIQKFGITSIEHLHPEKYREWIHLAQETATAGFVTLPMLWGSDVKMLQKILISFSKISSPLAIGEFNYFLCENSLNEFKVGRNIYPLWYSEQKIIETVVTYLASSGHKKIACFSAFWAKEDKKLLFSICQNLKQFFGNEAESFCYDLTLDKAMKDLPVLSPLNLKKVPKQALTNLPSFFWGHKFKKIDPLENAYMTLGRSVNEDMISQIAPFYFEKALKSGATAWICHGQELPFIAEKFLSKRKIAVPERLSLLALHSIQRSEGLNITAFDLCYDRMGYLAAHCILGDIPINKNRNGLVEYEWKLKVRKTVGRAKGEER